MPRRRGLQRLGMSAGGHRVSFQPAFAPGLFTASDGLLKVAGRASLGERAPTPTLAFESARALGDVWALTELWKGLGFGELRRVFRKTRHSTDIEALIRVMVLNRLCDPDSKLGVLRQLGMAKEGLIARQFMLGVVPTAEGLPIYHEVFDGNAAEPRALLPTLPSCSPSILATTSTIPPAPWPRRSRASCCW